MNCEVSGHDGRERETEEFSWVYFITNKHRCSPQFKCVLQYLTLYSYKHIKLSKELSFEQKL